MMHPDTRLAWINDAVGMGVVATAHLPRGTVLWMRDPVDQTFRPEEVDAMPPLLRKQVELYSYKDLDGSLVLAWDHGRQMNHSCDPSSASIGNLMEIALRDHAPGDEITCEYGFGHFIHAFVCTCGAAQCRGEANRPAGPEDWLRWDTQSAQAWQAAYTVDQGLLRAISPGQRGAWLLTALRDRRPVILPTWGARASQADWDQGPDRGASGK